MLKVGCQTYTWEMLGATWRGSVDDMLDAVAASGYEGIEITNEAGHEVYTISDAQLAEWKLAAQPVVQAWSESVRKVGGDPDAMLKELRDTLAKYNCAY